MNTFPYDSWYEALLRAWALVEPDPDNPGRLKQCFEAVDACVENELYNASAGYFTWGPGGNFATVLITLIAIVISVYAGVTVTRRENALLNESAERLAGKYNSNMEG